MKVGDVFYILDSNSRVYTKPKDGFGHMITRGAFRRHRIVGDTRLSWIIDRIRGGLKISKKRLAEGDLLNSGVACSVEEVDLICWAKTYRYKPIEQTFRHATPAQLMAIAKILNLDLPEPGDECSREELEALADWPGTWKEWAAAKLEKEKA